MLNAHKDPIMIENFIIPQKMEQINIQKSLEITILL